MNTRLYSDFVSFPIDIPFSLVGSSLGIVLQDVVTTSLNLLLAVIVSQSFLLCQDAGSFQK